MRDIRDITVVVGVKPLPGTWSGRDSRIRQVIFEAVQECSALYAAGIRSIMLQNVNDVPAYVSAPNYIIAAMTAVCCEARREVKSDCRMGISILRNDTPGGIAVANAAGLDFVRAKVFVGEMMKMEREVGNMNESLEMKLRLGSTAQIWADIQDRNGTPMFSSGYEADCGHALRGGADSLIITGRDVEQTRELTQRARNRFPSAKLIIGGGAKAENVDTLMENADGVIIASSLKVDGRISNPIDPRRVDAFVSAYLK